MPKEIPAPLNDSPPEEGQVTLFKQNNDHQVNPTLCMWHVLPMCALWWCLWALRTLEACNALELAATTSCATDVLISGVPLFAMMPRPANAALVHDLVPAEWHAPVCFFSLPFLHRC